MRRKLESPVKSADSWKQPTSEVNTCTMRSYIPCLSGSLPPSSSFSTNGERDPCSDTERRNLKVGTVDKGSTVISVHRSYPYPSNLAGVQSDVSLFVFAVDPSSPSCSCLHSIHPLHPPHPTTLVFSFKPFHKQRRAG